MKRLLPSCVFAFAVFILAAPSDADFVAYDSNRGTATRRPTMGIVGHVESTAGDKKKDVVGFPPVKRGPEYKVLEGLVGTFDAQVKMYVDPTDPKAPPKESKGVMTRKMILGGNFLQESYKGEFFGNTFTGMGLIGFDGNQKKYVNTWFDSMSTAPMILYGTYDADKKTLTMVGEDFDANTKKKMKARDVLKMVSPETQTFEMFRLPEGAPGEIKVMEISYTKRKVEKKK